MAYCDYAKPANLTWDTEVANSRDLIHFSKTKQNSTHKKNIKQASNEVSTTGKTEIPVCTNLVAAIFGCGQSWPEVLGPLVTAHSSLTGIFCEPGKGWLYLASGREVGEIDRPSFGS